jgi:hypothetical protein
MVYEPQHLVGMPEQVGRGAKTDDSINAVYLDRSEGCHLRQQISREIGEWQEDGLDLMAMFLQFLSEPFDNESSAPADERPIRRK